MINLAWAAGFTAVFWGMGVTGLGLARFIYRRSRETGYRLDGFGHAMVVLALGCIAFPPLAIWSHVQ